MQMTFKRHEYCFSLLKKRMIDCVKPTNKNKNKIFLFLFSSCFLYTFCSLRRQGVWHEWQLHLDLIDWIFYLSFYCLCTFMLYPNKQRLAFLLLQQRFFFWTWLCRMSCITCFSFWRCKNKLRASKRYNSCR